MTVTRNEKELRIIYMEIKLIWTIKRRKNVYLATSCVLNNTTYRSLSIIKGQLEEREALDEVSNIIIDYEFFQEMVAFQ